VNVHVTPGLANALAGVLNAARGRVPLLVTVGQQVLSMLPEEPFLGGDLMALARPLAKGAWEVERPEDLPRLLSLAVRTALEHPQGPTVLSLPLEIQAGPAPAAPAAATLLAAPPRPDPALVERAAALLGRARAPLVLAGDGVAHRGASAALAAVAERLGAPIHGESYAARLPIASDHPLWRGPLPPFAAEIARLVAPHDAVLAVGMPLFRLFGWSPGRALPEGVALVHAEVDPHEVGKVYAPDVGLVGDPAAALAGLAERLGPAPADARGRLAAQTAGTAELRRLARARIAAQAAAGGERISPAAFCLAVGAAAGRRDLIVDESLTAGRWLRAAAGRRRPGDWLGHRGSAIGWGITAAMGAKLADPGRRVLCTHGDGGFLFGAQALWVAAREGLNTAVVLADNGGYEILRAGLEGLTGRPEGGWPGLALAGPAIDYEGLSRSLGASAATVARRADLPEALRDLWRRTDDGPAVLVVKVSGRTPALGYPIAGMPTL
jgi:benzoylformate decarboxylase